MSAENNPIGARLRSERLKQRLTVEELAEAFRDNAGELERRRMPKLRDLARTIRGHEAGEHPPGPLYRKRYAAALGLGEDELFVQETSLRSRGTAPEPTGVLDPDERARLAFAVRRPARLDTTSVGSLAAILSAQRRAEDTVGSEAILEAASAHLRLLLRLLKDARGPLTVRLAATAADASQFVGWLYSATGRHTAAGPMYDQSLRLGLQAADGELTATALSMRGHLAWVTGDFGAMADLSQAARDMASSSGTRATAAQQRGRALALVGDRQGALRAIGQAEEELARSADVDDPDLLYFSGPALLLAQRGLILAYLAASPAEHREAADVISSGVDSLPPAIRDSEWLAWYRVQASRSRALGGEVGESAAGLRVALDIVNASGGAKTRTEIAEVQAAMAGRWPDDPAVAELADALR